MFIHGRMRIDVDAIDSTHGVLVAVDRGENHEISNSGNAELILIYFGVTM